MSVTRGKIGGVRYVGFDLDGTLYPTDGEINDRVRTRIAEKILERDPSLKTVLAARAYFEERYRELGRGTGVLATCGYSNASAVMDECLATANVLDLIVPNPALAEMMEEIHRTYRTYLITSGPKVLALSKLERIGIIPNFFDFRFFSDNPPGFLKVDGTAFQNALEVMGYSTGEWHVYVGDREGSDIVPAQALGMKTVKVGGSKGSADYLIEKIEDLRGLLL